MVRVNETDIMVQQRYAAERCLRDNGIDKDEVQTVLQALGYILLDTELYPGPFDQDISPFEMPEKVSATCSQCGRTEEYELDESEEEAYDEYVSKGGEAGMLQDLFPKVPAWIRAGGIDKRSGGFCTCPDCDPFSEGNKKMRKKPVKDDDRAEFVGQLIDSFEDFLEEKGIDIPNPDKAQSEDPAILYGMDYGQIQTDIEGTLVNWGIINPR